MKADSYSICKPIKNICKQYAVWINKDNSSRPLCYLQRPKSVTDKEWQEFIEALRLDLKRESE